MHKPHRQLLKPPPAPSIRRELVNWIHSPTQPPPVCHYVQTKLGDGGDEYIKITGYSCTRLTCT